MLCNKCGNKMDESAQFCSKCGVKVEGQLCDPPLLNDLNIPKNPDVVIIGDTASKTDSSEELLTNILGKNAQYYLREFNKIENGKSSVNWGALLFGPIVVSYRKQFFYLAKVFIPGFIMMLIPYIIQIIQYIVARPLSRDHNFWYITLIEVLTLIYWLVVSVITGIGFNKIYRKNLVNYIEKNEVSTVGSTDLIQNSAVRKVTPSMTGTIPVFLLYLACIIIPMIAPSDVQLKQADYIVLGNGQSVKEATSQITEDEALVIAQQWLDDHPLYERIVVGIREHGELSYENMDISNLYRIHIVDTAGEDKTMFVDKTTGNIFISADGKTLLTGEQFYEVMYLNPSEITEEIAKHLIENWLVEHPLEYDVIVEPLWYEGGIRAGADDGYLTYQLVYEDIPIMLIYVDQNNGELLLSGQSELIPMDEWYQNEFGGIPQRHTWSDDYGITKTVIDPELLGGRWVDSINGYRLEFFEDGSISTNINFFQELESRYPIETEIETANGWLMIYGTQRIENSYELNIDGTKTVLNYAGALFNRKDGTNDGTNDLVGDWIPANNNTMNYYVFNSDGTGFGGNNMIREEFGTSGIAFEWYADDITLTFVFKEDLSFDYLVQGSTLTLFTADGSISFTRVGS